MLHKMGRIKWSDAGLEHHTPEDFTRCQWQRTEKVSICWLIYRVVLAIYAFVTWVLSLINYNRVQTSNKYLIYLTNWSYLLLTFQFLLALGILIHKFITTRWKTNQEESNITKMPVIYKIYWACHIICTPCAFVVTAIFWGAIFNPETNPVDVINITTHGINSVVMLTDFLLVAYPYKILHFYWPLCYAATYAIFTFIYHLFGGTDVYDRPFIYAILDWNHPEKALITTVIAVVFLTIIHFILWGLSKFKQWLKNVCWSARAKKYAEGQENLAMDTSNGRAPALIV